MQVGLSDLKMLTGHQGRNKPSLADAPYIHTLGREYLSVTLNLYATAIHSVTKRFTKPEKQLHS